MELSRKKKQGSEGHIGKLIKNNPKITSPWELMDPRTKNDSDKTQDIRIPYVGNEYV